MTDKILLSRAQLVAAAATAEEMSIPQTAPDFKTVLSAWSEDLKDRRISPATRESYRRASHSLCQTAPARRGL